MKMAKLIRCSQKLRTQKRAISDFTDGKNCRTKRYGQTLSDERFFLLLALRGDRRLKIPRGIFSRCSLGLLIDLSQGNDCFLSNANLIWTINYTPVRDSSLLLVTTSTGRSYRIRS